MNYKIFTAGFLSVVLFSACSITSVNQEKKFEKKDNKIQTQSYYYGTIPCASCPGIETKLTLISTNDKINYILIEKYLEEKNANFKTEGKATIKNNVLTLFNKGKIFKKIFISKNYINFDIKDKNKLYKLGKKWNI